MRIDVLTLFPEVFGPYLSSGIVGRAIAAGIVSIRCTDFRRFATDRHRSVDDRPFGGGPGMLLMCGPIFDAIERLDAEAGIPGERILLTPQGERLSQRLAGELARERRIVLICGHYEGFDERIRQGLAARELSIGDYVLSGGEPAALVVIDAIVRLVPGVLGDATSAAYESFSGPMLEHPQYTRPRVFRGMNVPDVLLSGDHAQISEWRKAEAHRRTRERRPELLDDASEM